MTTRAILRQLVTRAGILLLATVVALVSMNLVTDSRIELERQRGLQDRFGSILSAERYDPLPLNETGTDEAGIVAAYTAHNTSSEIVGYVIESIVFTEQGEILCRIGISSDGSTIIALSVDDESAKDTLGFVRTEAFLQQFSNARLPCALTIDLPDEKTDEETYLPLSGLADGVFRAEADSPDQAGYKDFVEIEVIQGRIERVVWDATQADGGTNRAAASVNGEYKLSDNTIIWAAQAYAMQNKLIEVQDPAKIAIKASGTTDVVQGVSISVNAFLTLANKCIENARNTKTSDPVNGPATTPTDAMTDTDTPSAQENTQTQVEDALTGIEDGVVKDSEQFQAEFMIDGFPIVEVQTKITKADGADEASRSVVRAVNLAYRFIMDYRKGVT